MVNMKLSNLFTCFNPRVKTLLKIYSICYWTVYFVKSFCIWELRNPFEWVFNIPNDEQLRLSLSMAGFLLIFFSIAIYKMFLYPDGKFKK